MGLDDLVLKPEANRRRRMTIERSHMNGVSAAAEYAGMTGYQI